MIAHIWQEIGKQFQFFKHLGVRWLLGVTAPGIELQAFSVTGGGTGTDAVVFESVSVNGQALKSMASATYQVLIGGQFVAAMGNAVYPSLATYTAAGFSIIGLGAETCHVVVIGRTAGMPDPTL
jgi:hypothetical protein